MTYKRNIPKDLINEGKLLKCLGELITRLQTDKLPKVYAIDIIVEHQNFDIEGNSCKNFSVSFTEDPGTIFVDNLKVLLNSKELDFYAYRDSEYEYPLECYFDGVEYTIFKEDGEFHHEFFMLLGEL